MKSRPICSRCSNRQAARVEQLPHSMPCKVPTEERARRSETARADDAISVKYLTAYTDTFFLGERARESHRIDPILWVRTGREWGSKYKTTTKGV